MSIDKQAIFVKILERENPFAVYSYDYIKSEEKKSELVGNSVSCFFYNKKLNQTIELKYTEGVQGYLILYIKRGDANFAKDILNIESYLKYKKNIYQNNFDLKNIGGGFEEKIYTFIRYLKKEINPLIENVLLKNDWDTIPIDWQQYK